MKKVTLSLACFFFSSALLAQKIYFVYIQTDNRRPFFVRMNEKVYSSTASGYLILSKLIDSTYNYKIGFPGQNVDLDFSTTINKKDHGFLLRNFGAKGWGLIDLQTLSIQMQAPDQKSSATLNMKPDSNINAFTELLAKAADDSTLKYVSVVQEEPKKEETKNDIIQPVVKVDVPAKTNTGQKKADELKTGQEKKTEAVKTDSPPEKKPDIVTTNSEEKKTEPTEKKPDVEKTEPEKKSEPVKNAPYKRSEVTRISQNHVVDGVEIVYSDKQGEKTDTVTIVIDQPKVLAKTGEKIEEKKGEKKFLDISTDSVKTANNETPVVEKKDAGIAADSANVKGNQPGEKKVDLKKLWPFNKGKEKKCDVADNNDFLKLRRKMAARTNDDGMIGEARKYFKSKCFTTEQIKNLSSMFLSNAGKYHFFSAAYEYVADKENFSSLQSELKDEYYLGRFKALVQN